MTGALAANPLAFREVNDVARVKAYGEVFTPLAFVEKMTALIDNSFWSDRSTLFIEPTCGDGAFLVLVIRKRYLGLLRAATSSDAQKESLEKRMDAMALALDLSFGFDLLKDNVTACRSNILKMVAMEIPETVAKNSLNKIEGEFLAWACGAIAWGVRTQNALHIKKAPERFSSQRLTRKERSFKTMMGQLRRVATGLPCFETYRFIDAALTKEKR